MDMDGGRQHATHRFVGRLAWGVRHLGNACCQKRPWKPRWDRLLDRFERQFLALWGFRRRCHWRQWPRKRPLGVQLFHKAVGMDKREQHGRRQWRPASSVWLIGSARCGKYAWRSRVASILDGLERPFLALRRLGILLRK